MLAVNSKSFLFSFFLGFCLISNSSSAFEFSRKGLDDILQNIKDPFHYYEDYCPKSQNTNVNQVMCLPEANVITPKPDAIEQISLSSEELEEWIWIKESADRRAQETKALFAKQSKIKAALRDPKSKENKELRIAMNLAIQAEAAIQQAKNCDSFLANNKTCNQYPRSEWKKKLENAQKAKALILAEEPLLLHKDLDWLIRKNGNLSAFPMDSYKGYDTGSAEFTNALETAVTDREKYYKTLWDKYEVLQKNEIKMGELVNTSQKGSSQNSEYKDLVKATINDKSILVDLTQSDTSKYDKKKQDPLMFAKCRIENRVLKKESQKDSAMFAANAFLAVTPMGMSSIAVRASTTLARIAPMTSTVALTASDMAALKSQENECKQLQNTAQEGKAENIEKFQDCVDTYKNQMFMTLLGMGGAAKGTKLAKNAMSEGQQLKSAVSQELESPFASLRADRGGFEPISNRSYDVIIQTPPEQKLKISFTGLSKGEKDQWMTTTDLSDYLKKNPSAEFEVRGASSIAKAENISPEVTKKFESGWIKPQLETDPEGIIEKTVYLKSGEAVSVSGNADRFLEIAKNPNVEKITYEDVKPWYRRLSEVPAEQQSSKFDIYKAKLSEFNGVAYNSLDNGSDIAGKKIYHGTLDVYENSIRSGPKNVGKGFGGSGLYVSLDGERDIAVGFAEMAKREAKDRLQQVDGVLTNRVDPKKTRSILMEGTINPNKNLKIARFQVDRNISEPDFKRGILPADWASDPVLKRVLEKEFDVLEITNMKSSGLALDTDRVLIFHERAGPEAILWNKVERF